MNQDPLHTPEDTSGDWLKRSFEGWDAGVPSDAVWNELDASVAAERVWSRLEQSLETEEHLPDSWMVAAHQAWEPSDPADGWERLSESIALEQVWRDLNQSLDRQPATRPAYWKLAVASVVALLISMHFSDAPQPLRPGNGQGIAITATTDATGPSNTSGSAQQMPPENTTGSTPQTLRPGYEAVTRSMFTARTSLLANASSDFALLAIVPNHAIAQPALPALLSRAQEIPASWYIGNITLLTQHQPKEQPFNHWTAQIGAQLSVLQERDQSMLTSTLPRFGLAADLSYRHRVGPFQLIHAAGVSQYSQSAGKYVNGRHLTASQQVNAVQVHSSVGYTYKRFTVYGGVLVSKLLNGLEQNNNTVTKVYDFNRLQAGMTAGIDVRLLTFKRSGKQLSFGSQYQWIPSAGSSKAAFDNIQGLRFQTKFSF